MAFVTNNPSPSARPITSSNEPPDVTTIINDRHFCTWWGYFAVDSLVGSVTFRFFAVVERSNGGITL